MIMLRLSFTTGVEKYWQGFHPGRWTPSPKRKQFKVSSPAKPRVSYVMQIKSFECSVPQFPPLMWGQWSNASLFHKDVVKWETMFINVREVWSHAGGRKSFLNAIEQSKVWVEWLCDWQKDYTCVYLHFISKQDDKLGLILPIQTCRSSSYGIGFNTPRSLHTGS